jgi:hypothetical protein
MGKRSSFRRRFILLAVVAAPIWIAAAVVAMAVLTPRDAMEAAVVASLAALGIAYGWHRLTRRPWTRQHLMDEIAAVRMCVCCGYDLEGLPSANDGRVVGPECGAAWRM